MKTGTKTMQHDIRIKLHHLSVRIDGTQEQSEIAQIREVYPLNNGGDVANKSIKKAISDHGFEKVLQGTTKYAEKNRTTEKKFIKSTVRFFKEEVFLDYLVVASSSKCIL